MTTEEMLYCVGCGVAVISSRPGQVLAMSCRCGANAPILHSEAHTSWAPPASFVLATGVKPPPHLEYYLGFSDHESPLKTEVTRQLRAMGSVSFTECPEERCPRAFERGKSEWEEMQRQDAAREGS